jgi:2-polyprenyl-3-methyl-5-hydroxy-6-metoxy-1,4-benzoquinol methylase
VESKLINQSDSCVFCNTSKIKVIIPSYALPCKVAVLKCSDCGLVFLESREEANQEDREERLYWQGEQKQIYLQEQVQKAFEDEFAKRLAELRKYLPSNGSLLDVGCGVGHFLNKARDFGYFVKGLDISPVAAQAAKEKYNIEVDVGTLEQADYPHNHFDVVSLWDVIEHIRRPLENMKAINHFLKPGGILVMKTPNEDSFFKWVARFVFCVLGQKGTFLLKYVYYIPHYYSYSKTTMSLLLQKSGFEAVAYEFDETPAEFGAEKINVHYKKDSKRSLVIALLPAAQFLARLTKRQNKLVVYARKIRTIE